MEQQLPLNKRMKRRCPDCCIVSVVECNVIIVLCVCCHVDPAPTTVYIEKPGIRWCAVFTKNHSTHDKCAYKKINLWENQAPIGHRTHVYQPYFGGASWFSHESIINQLPCTPSEARSCRTVGRREGTST